MEQKQNILAIQTFWTKEWQKKGIIHCWSPAEKKATMTILKLTLRILLLLVSPTSSSHKQKIKHGIAGNGNTYAMSQRTLQKRHKMQTLIQSIVPTPILVPLCHILAWSNEKPRCSVVAQAACSQKKNMIEKQMALCASPKCFRMHEELRHRLHLTILARTSQDSHCCHSLCRSLYFRSCYARHSHLQSCTSRSREKKMRMER